MNKARIRAILTRMEGSIRDLRAELGEGAGKKASKRCPADWTPKDSHYALAEELGVDLRAQLTQFADWEFKTAKCDWDAAFRNWLRRAGKSGGSFL